MASHVTLRALQVLQGVPATAKPGDTACGLRADPIRYDFGDSMPKGDTVLTVSETLRLKVLRIAPKMITCPKCSVHWDMSIT